LETFAEELCGEGVVDFGEESWMADALGAGDDAIDRSGGGIFLKRAVFQLF
jgi:hypothetical protein